MLSEKIRRIEESQTLAISAKAKEMKRQGIDIISLSAGEPDFDTPQHIKEAAEEAIRKGMTKYTKVSGIPELKKAITKKFLDNKIKYSEDEIIVSNGAKQVLYNAMLTLLNKGDEIIIPIPYWVTFIEQAKLADASPVLIETEKFRITADKIEEKINKKTKAILINTPNNPSGYVVEKNDLIKIAELAVQNNLWLIMDEVYEKIIYEQEHFSIASFNDEVKKLTITINAVSKTYSMTGWRIGYAGAQKDVIRAMTNLQSHTTSNPNSIAQYAALAALTGPQEYVDMARKEFWKRRDLIVKRLNEMEDVNCEKPGGAFYVFPDFSLIEESSLKLASQLLEKAKVAIVPGIAFGLEGYLRFSYASSIKDINEAMDRVEKFLRSRK